jgi:murein DD-endopeptidase MepM/ murein hydrolase activator NlpD
MAGVLFLLFFVAMNQGKPRMVGPGQTPAASDTTSSALAPKGPDHAGIVAPNTSFFDIMMNCGLDAPSIKLIEKAVRNVYDFRRIYPDQHYEIYNAEDGSIQSMQFSVNDESYIDINIKDGDISAEKKEYDFSLNLKTASGTIRSSLFSALDERGIPVDLGVQLSNIFAWDIDFFSDMRSGDYFRMIYEEKTRFDGMKKIGRIVAAEFCTQGRSHYAFLYRNEEGKADYFDETGKSLRKQLLRAPLSYTRISSNFSRRRFHPVLHHYAPHLGIDYAAPIGTPVMATGNGAVLVAGRSPANGNYVKIRHTNSYITYYLHLSRFAKGICPGARVQQGQVIGYVGMTGYATGPHLDYRVMIHNQFVNPRTISLPPANPITNDNMASFIEIRDRHLARLANIPTREETQAVASTAAPQAVSSDLDDTGVRDSRSGISQ